MRVAVLVLIAVLAGCTTQPGAGLVRPQLPQLDPRISKPCYVPTIKAGENAKAWAAKVAGALAACRDKHGNVVAVYEDLRTGLAGK